MPEYVNNYIIKIGLSYKMSRTSTKTRNYFKKRMCCIVNEICPPRKIRIREDNQKWETYLTQKCYMPEIEPDRKSPNPTVTSLSD